MSRIKSVVATATVAAAGALALIFSSPAPAAAADTYPYGQCTYYAKAQRPDVGNQWGDARYWAGRARAAGFPVDSRPRVGDVAVLDRNVQGRSPYGHVAIVIGVTGNHFKTLSMWGNEGSGRVHVTVLHVGPGVSFIHHRGGTTAAIGKTKTGKPQPAKPTTKVTKPTGKHHK